VFADIAELLVQVRQPHTCRKDSLPLLLLD
jgi:hypothetical protein